MIRRVLAAVGAALASRRARRPDPTSAAAADRRTDERRGGWKDVAPPDPASRPRGLPPRPFLSGDALAAAQERPVWCCRCGARPFTTEASCPRCGRLRTWGDEDL
jgi:hypothetical protein